MNNLNDLRENIHELNIKLNELAKDNFDLHEKNEILHFQIKVKISIFFDYILKTKNMRDKENLRPHDELIEDKISFISNKNEKLILENNKLNNKVSLLSGHYFELIKNFKKKIFDFNRFAMQETHTFQIYKENVQNDLKTYIEKVLFSF